LDGCFIKLTAIQQILASTRRDGNNNMYPIAFGLADKEDTTSWCWFLCQLNYAIGGEGKLGKYNRLSDRQNLIQTYKIACCPFDLLNTLVAFGYYTFLFSSRFLV
jgi:hypothetical protein